MSRRDVGVQACSCPASSGLKLTEVEHEIIVRYRELSEIDQTYFQRIAHVLTEERRNSAVPYALD